MSAPISAAIVKRWESCLMGIQTTKLHGLKSQLEVMPSHLQDMEGYEEVDLNAYWEAVCSIDEAIAWIVTAIEEMTSER